MTSTTTPAHLAGNFAPVADELTATELAVTGSVPAELTGWYLRNGPNPHAAASGHWFTGDGMVHGVRLEQGRAVAYRNRWVRTARFRGEPETSLLTGGTANTHVVRHAGRTLALVESSFPEEITPELDTVGPFDFDGKLTTSMTAHPKTCPDTGELHFFGYSYTEPFVTYHRADASGELVFSRPVEVPGPTMMHDFALTAGHVLFLDLPVVFDLPAARAGQAMPYRWQPGYGARLGVLRRDDPAGPVRWFDVEPCYVFHVLNAHDEPDAIVLHVVRHPHTFAPDLPAAPATLWRWRLDLTTGTVTETQLDDRRTEFPRIDDRLAGHDARYGHLVTTAAPGGAPERDLRGTVLRYDLHTGAVLAHEFGPGRLPAEAAFAPADDRPGGDGWLLCYVYDEAANSSDLVILDTTRLSGPAQAVIHLPRRVPYGFHGNWLPDPIHS